MRTIDIIRRIVLPALSSARWSHDMVFHARIGRLSCGQSSPCTRSHCLREGSQIASNTNSEEATTSSECHGLRRLFMSSRTQVAKLASENGLGNVFWDGSSIRVLRRSQYPNAVAKDCEIVEVAEVPLGLKRCTSLHCLHYGILNPKPPQAEQA